MQYVLVGNYGVGNLGDEALREYFLKTFSDIGWIVVTANPTKPNDVPRLPLGIRSFFRFDFWRTIRALRRSRGIVFGGGSLFTDTESVFACALWWMHAAVARLFGKKIYLANQGIGPFRTKLGERLCRWVLARASFISVRDEESYERVRSYNLPIECVQSFDPVFSEIHPNASRHSQRILALIPRKNSTDAFRKKFKSLCAQETFDEIHIFSLQPDDPDESSIAASLTSVCQKPTIVIPIRTLAELEEGLQVSSKVLSERYHGSLAALALGIPCVSLQQADGDKLAVLSQIQPSQIPVLRERLEKGERMLRSALR